MSTPDKSSTPADAAKGTVGKTLDEVKQGAGGTTPKKGQPQGQYVVFEEIALEGGDVSYVEVSRQTAPERESACWRAVEEPGTDLNARAMSDNPPKLVAISTGRGGWQDPSAYQLEQVAATRRKKA